MRQRIAPASFVSQKLFIATLMAFAILCAGTPKVNASATLRISGDDGQTWTSIIDNGPLDLDTNVGSILYNGNGLGFSGVFVGSSQHATDLPSYVDLNCSVYSASRPLIFQYSDDGFGPFMGVFESSIGGNASTTVSCNSYMDPSGQLFSGTNLTGVTGLSGNFAWSAKTATYSTGTFSLTAEAKTTTAADSTSFDMLLEAYSPQRPVITCSRNSTNGVNLSFDTESGFTYVLESKSALTNGSWTPLQSVPGNDSTVTLQDSSATNQKIFYRVSVH